MICRERGRREGGGKGKGEREGEVRSRMVTVITRPFGINLCQDMAERDKTGEALSTTTINGELQDINYITMNRPMKQ